MSMFRAVKHVPFPDVIKRFYSRQPVFGNKIICPFHSERTASFHVYPDGGKCYGCNWSGDSITFVAELRGLRPYEAALAIAREFGITISTRQHVIMSKAERQKQRAAINRRTAQKKYEQLKQSAFLALADFRDLAVAVFEAEGINIDPDLVDAMHMLPQVEYYLEVLSVGSENDKLDLLRKGVITQWAKLRSFQTGMSHS